jgi:hypothetical protein
MQVVAVTPDFDHLIAALVQTRLEVVQPDAMPHWPVSTQRMGESVFQRPEQVMSQD